MQRARQTAQIVGAAVGLEPQVIPALAEWEPPAYTLPVRWLVEALLGPASRPRVRDSALGRRLRAEWWLGRAVRRRLPAGRLQRRVGGTTAALAARHLGARITWSATAGRSGPRSATSGSNPPGSTTWTPSGCAHSPVLHLSGAGGPPHVACFDCTTIPHSRPAY